MPSNKRPPENESGMQTLTLSGLTGGFNDYTNPELMSPQFWAAASNVYSGMHGTVRRARWAPVENAASLDLNAFQGNYADGSVITDIFSFTPIGATHPILILTNGNTPAGPPPAAPNMFPIGVFWFGFTGGPPIAFTRYSYPTLDPSLLLGPYMRYSSSPQMILQTNGLVRSKLIFDNSVGFAWEFWGIDAPDVSPSISLSSGVSATVNSAGANRVSNIASLTASATLPAEFIVGAWMGAFVTGDSSFNNPTGVSVQIVSISTVTNPNDTVSYENVGPNVTGAGSGGGVALQITKTVGRSYQYAWENENTGHVSAPSPASQYIAYSNQYGTVDLIEVGTIASIIGTTVLGTNTAFTSAWVGRWLYVDGVGVSSRNLLVVSVQSPTHLTVGIAGGGDVGTFKFQVYDSQSTHVRLYATGDGGATYLLIGRNLFNSASATLADSGLEFIDTDNSEPPDGSFTNELAQNQNVPPPIGSFLQDYQGRVLVYGVPGALQSFFYSNIEATVVGQPPESFSPLNEVTLPVGEAQLNGMANLPTGCMMWSSKQDMFKLTGTLTDNTIANAQQLGASIQRLPYKIGCASAYATAVTSLGAFWLSSDREVWLFTDHYAPKNIGKPIQNLLNQATRISFARMKNYKSGDRNWIALAITVGEDTKNNTLCLLDLDLLASNGQPSFFTFDMASNQPSWYIYNVDCESIEAAFDSVSTNHLLVGDVDLVTDMDWTDGYYTVSAEQSIPASGLTLHALGNQDPEVIKTGRWMRVTTNQLPKNFASQGWNWAILCYDDDKYVLGINPQTVQLVPGVNSPNQVFALEYSPSVFRFGGIRPVKGRRFQIQTNFPSGPGFYELRGFQVSFDEIVAR